MLVHRATTDLPRQLREHLKTIRATAREAGLDFFDVVFEVVDFETMNQIAAYGGFPVRYPHWRWGMEYEKLRKRDAYGLGRIYELVVNNDPCYAYLQESNSLLDQKLVMAHVFAHADFFKNNLWFSKTNRKMVDDMANHATRVRRHIEREGQERVERFLDLCLSVETLIDPHSMFMKRKGADEQDDDEQRDQRNQSRSSAKRRALSPGLDRLANPRPDDDSRSDDGAEPAPARSRTPAAPTRDALLFLLEHAPLESWQRDILAIVREEAYYFAPQAMTKIMNEGWATYWHSKLMTESLLEPAEIVDYADQHSGVVHMPVGAFNPYKLGVELFKDIERRWDRGQHGPQWERLDSVGARERYDDKSLKGREKIFEVRRIYNDVQFLDEFLTEEFVDSRRMFRWRRDPRTGKLHRIDSDFGQIKQTLLARLANSGQPYIYVVDANYLNRGELYLAQRWIGADLDVASAMETLKALRRLWGRPVRLQARVDDELWLFTCDDPDEAVSRQVVDEDTPPPAHSL